MAKSYSGIVLRGLLYSANILVIGLLLLPFLGAYIIDWRIDNLANLQWQWLLCGLFLMVMNLVLRFRFSSWCTAVLLALMVTQQWFLYQPVHPSVADGQSLKIAQFNISYSNGYLSELLPQLGAADFDLLVLQEASDSQAFNVNLLGQYYPYSLGLDPLEATPSGLVIFSRWPIIESQIHVLAAQSTHILEVVVQSPEQQIPVQIYAIHPVSPRTERLWQQRNATFDYLQQLIDISPLNNKVIIGDFNSSHWSPAFKRLAHQAQLKNSAAGFGYIPSWSYANHPAWWPLLSAYIDHCLVSEQITVLNKQQQIMQGSDHRLIKTMLAIPRPSYVKVLF